MRTCIIAMLALLVTQTLHAAEFTVASLSADVEATAAELQAVNSKAGAEAFVKAHMLPATVAKLKAADQLDPIMEIFSGENAIKAQQVASLKQLDFKRVAIDAARQMMTVPSQAAADEKTDFVLVDNHWYIAN